MGLHPIIMTTSERLANNLTCYIESTAPALYPGGGGFSINNFTLEGLYKQHLVLKNWWTVGNDNMPLIRYLGCDIQLYRSTNLDYLFQYRNAYPMQATLLTYTSTQPQAMLLHKHTIKMACKQHNKNKKPYKKIHIPPPSQMLNKWYFQKDIAEIPLLQTIATATSFDRMFQNSKSVNTTVGFTSLDILGFRNHDYSKLSTTGYMALPNQLLFGITTGDYNLKSIKLTSLIFLGNPEDDTEGTRIGQIPNTEYNHYSDLTTTLAKQLKAVRLNNKHWGNPFTVTFHRVGRLITTNKTWDELIQKYNNSSQADVLIDTWFTFKQHTFIDCRYNPYADQGLGNKLYLIDIKDKAHDTDWDIPAQGTLYKDLPIWLMVWGYLDFHRKCGEHSQIDTNYIAVIYTNYIFPKDTHYFVPLDQDFLNGRSPYQPEEHITPSDSQNWHPKVRFQVQTINALAASGPATVKLPPETSVESHIRYRFRFKIGGEPPPMATLTDPDKQPKYNIPNNLLQTPSLQNPTTPFEYLL